MIKIIRGRDSGKAKELLKYAHENNYTILTQDKKTFEVKAKSYGYPDVTIIDYEDLKDDTYDYGDSVLVHNGDKMLGWLLDYFYGLNLEGFTATEE